MQEKKFNLKVGDDTTVICLLDKAAQALTDHKEDEAMGFVRQAIAKDKQLLSDFSFRLECVRKGCNCEESLVFIIADIRDTIGA